MAGTGGSSEQPFVLSQEKVRICLKVKWIHLQKYLSMPGVLNCSGSDLFFCCRQSTWYQFLETAVILWLFNVITFYFCFTTHWSLGFFLMATSSGNRTVTDERQGLFKKKWENFFSPKVNHSKLKTGRNHHDFSHEDAALLLQLGSCPARVELLLLSGLNAVAIVVGLAAEERSVQALA